MFYQVSSDFSFEITFCADMILQFMMFHWVFPFGHVRTEVTFHILFINMIASCVSLQSAVGRRGKLAKIAFQIRFHFMFCFNVHFKMTLLHSEHICFDALSLAMLFLVLLLLLLLLGDWVRVITMPFSANLWLPTLALLQKRFGSRRWRCKTFDCF